VPLTRVLHRLASLITESALHGISCYSGKYGREVAAYKFNKDFSSRQYEILSEMTGRGSVETVASAQCQHSSRVTTVSIAYYLGRLIQMTVTGIMC